MSSLLHAVLLSSSTAALTLNWKSLRQTSPTPWEVRTDFGRAFLCKEIPPELQPVWQASFRTYDHDHRYYEVTRQALDGQFDQHYLLLEDPAGKLQAVQPLFLVTHDLLEGLHPAIKRAANRLRQHIPGLLSMRMLMVGSPAGEGDLPNPVGDASQQWVADALHEVLPAVARHFKSPLIVLKDFPKHYRELLRTFSSNGYSRLPSMPATSLHLKYSSFDDYVARELSKKTRQNLRKKFKDAEKFPTISLEVVSDIAPHIDIVYPLYQQVLHRARFRFEELSREYFLELSRTMPDRVRFFLWRMEGRIVAFSVCLVHNGTLYDKYIGIDYSIALDAHLYFVTLRDTLEWAIRNGVTTYYSAPLNYDPKRHLRQKLVPLDLYTRHTSDWVNVIYRRIVTMLGPTRHDPILAQFENFKDLE